MFAGWRSVLSEACASAESGAELGEAGLSVIELTLRTFIVHTQTKPGKLWGATRGPQGAR